MDEKDEKLLPSNPADVAFTLRHALLFDGRRRFDASRQQMADITTAHLLEALRKSGFVVMKRPVKEPLNHWPTGPQSAD